MKCMSSSSERNEENERAEGCIRICLLLVMIGLAGLTALVAILAIIYLGTWLVLGFGIGLYLFFVTFSYPVRSSTTTTSTTFQVGLVVFAVLNDIVAVCELGGGVIVGGQVVATVGTPAQDTETAPPRQPSQTGRPGASPRVAPAETELVSFNTTNPRLQRVYY